MKRFKAWILVLVLLLSSSGTAYGVTGNSGSNMGLGYMVKRIYYSSNGTKLFVEGYFVNSTNDVIQRVNTVRLNINGRDGFVIAQAVSGGSLNNLDLKPGATKDWNFLLDKPIPNKDLSWTECNIDYDYDIGETFDLGTGIKVFYKGDRIKYDVPPSVINNRTLIPARLTFEKMGGKVDWEPSTKTVIITRWDKKIVIKVGDRKMTVNGKDVALDVPAQVLDGRTLIPLRAVSAALDCKINWGDEDKIIVILEAQ